MNDRCEKAYLRGNKKKERKPRYAFDFPVRMTSIALLTQPSSSTTRGPTATTREYGMSLSSPKTLLARRWQSSPCAASGGTCRPQIRQNSTAASSKTYWMRRLHIEWDIPFRYKVCVFLPNLLLGPFALRQRGLSFHRHGTLLLLCLFQPELTSRSEYAGYPVSFSNKVLLIGVYCGGV
jgi:hypothetical protein